MTLNQLVKELQDIMTVHPEAREETVQVRIAVPCPASEHPALCNLRAVRLTRKTVILED